MVVSVMIGISHGQRNGAVYSTNISVQPGHFVVRGTVQIPPNQAFYADADLAQLRERSTSEGPWFDPRSGHSDSSYEMFDLCHVGWAAKGCVRWLAPTCRNQ